MALGARLVLRDGLGGGMGVTGVGGEAQEGGASDGHCASESLRCTAETKHDIVKQLCAN